MERMEHEARYESWEQLLVKDRNSFLQVVIQKYVRNRFHEEKVEEVFRLLGDVPGNDERFITVCVDIDLAYKITNSLDYEASRFALIRRLEEVIGEQVLLLEGGRRWRRKRVYHPHDGERCGQNSERNAGTCKEG